MAGSNSFKETVESLFHGMDSVITSKTVVGEAIHINGTIILPLTVSYTHLTLPTNSRV